MISLINLKNDLPSLLRAEFPTGIPSNQSQIRRMSTVFTKTWFRSSNALRSPRSLFSHKQEGNKTQQKKVVNNSLLTCEKQEYAIWQPKYGNAYRVRVIESLESDRFYCTSFAAEVEQQLMASLQKLPVVCVIGTPADSISISTAWNLVTVDYLALR